MSLIRFLAAGRCLMGKDTSLGRYRFDKHFRLPKFGPAKNPFETAKPAEPAPAPELQPAPEQPSTLEPVAAPVPANQLPPAGAPAAMPPAETPTADLTQTQRVAEVVSVRQPKSAGKLRNPPGRFLSGIKQRAAKLNPRSWFPRRRAKVKPALPPGGKQIVQGELSLENVKVVRNDLNDADLEVVPAVAPADSGDAPAARLKRKASLSAASPLAEAKQL